VGKGERLRAQTLGLSWKTTHALPDLKKKRPLGGSKATVERKQLCPGKH